MIDLCAPPITDELAINLRAYAVDAAQPSAGKPTKPKAILPASTWSVAFDTETVIDAGQSLRFGTYQVRQGGELKGEGIFFDPEGTTDVEVDLMRSYAASNGLDLITREQFVDEILFGIGWACSATIIGFNLPFDISRIAIAHSSARGEMRSGFSFKMSEQKIFPHIQIKHLSQRAAFIRFAKPMGQFASKGMRNQNFNSAERRGHFVDVKTLAGALLERSFTLAGLSKFLKVENPKLDFDNFDHPISEEILTYALRDVQATWECYSELISRFDRLGFTNLVPENVYSAASIGKGYLKEMGIVPWRKLQPDFPAQITANILSSYFGGRSEVRIRRELRQVTLCDFLSMYPTVCTLMGLWKFVIADGMACADATEEARRFLESVDLVALRQPTAWRNLAILVRVKAKGDIFPVRAAYMDEPQSTIGLNHLTADTPLWFTLADCIASKLLTGKAPEIIEAIRFVPGPTQVGLRPADISGNPAYRVDPNEQDFFKRVIELRQSVKSRLRYGEGDEAEALDIEQNALKIAANSTAYGVYVEINVVKRGKPAQVIVTNSTSRPFGFLTDKVEETGTYFHPLLASLITGAARLMLAITERLVADEGLEWAFCDTDSMAIAKPDTIAADLYAAKVDSIVAWFETLNPYEFGGSILKVEDVNFALDTCKPEPLHCWAISAKRYALFNVASGHQPVMRKVSAHGLGHRLSPYEAADASKQFPAPHVSVLKDGIKRWHVDLWQVVVKAALNGAPDIVAPNYHPSLRQSVISRYGATSPEMLRWFRVYNLGKPYRDQVKPFGFLLSLSSKKLACRERMVFATSGRRRRKARPIKPVTTFDRDFRVAIANAFDRDTGDALPTKSLRTYSEDLSGYHLHPETKFLNGDHFDRGPTRRRHVRMIATRHIGKESNDWEAQAILGFDPSTAPDYQFSEGEFDSFKEMLVKQIERTSAAKVAKDLRLSRHGLDKLIRANGSSPPAPEMPRLVAKLRSAIAGTARRDANRQKENAELRARIKRHGLRETAGRLSVDPSNLRRRLNSRKLS